MESLSKLRISPDLWLDKEPSKEVLDIFTEARIFLTEGAQGSKY